MIDNKKGNILVHITIPNLFQHHTVHNITPIIVCFFQAKVGRHAHKSNNKSQEAAAGAADGLKAF